MKERCQASWLCEGISFSFSAVFADASACALMQTRLAPFFSGAALAVLD
jgi:hypothetical protein